MSWRSTTEEHWLNFLWKCLTCTIIWPAAMPRFYKIGRSLEHRGGTWGAPIVGMVGLITVVIMLIFAVLPGHGFSSIGFMVGVAAYAVEYLVLAGLVFSVLTEP